MNHRLATVTGLLLSLASWAAAQPAPRPAPAAPAPPPAVPAPANPEVELRLPEVSDPMLTPPPPPPRVLNSWQQALTLVRARSSDLRLAAAQVDQTEGLRRQSLSRALPTLTGVGVLTHHLLRGQGFIRDDDTGAFVPGEIPDPATTWQAGLELRVPVFAPQAWYDAATASRSIRAAKLTGKETERLVLGALANAIVGVVTGERLSEVSRVSLRAALSNLDLNQRRQRLGAATAVDVLRAQQEVERARAQVVAADENLRQGREALGLTLGTYEPWGVTPNTRLDALAADARASCRIETNIDSRSDIQAAEANLDVARRNTNSVDWTYAPSVDFVSDLTYLSHAERRSPNGEPVIWTIGGLLTWPLYDGGLRYGQRSVNEAQTRIAQEQLTTAKRQARLELAQTQRAVVVAQSQLDISRRSRDVLRETARLARVAFVNGSGTSFELNETERQLREAELDTAVKEFEVMRAKIAALLASSNCDV
jgi:outer membrane protein TolC